RVLKVNQIFLRTSIPPALHAYPTRRSSDLMPRYTAARRPGATASWRRPSRRRRPSRSESPARPATLNGCGCAALTWDNILGESRSEEHTSELQSRENLVWRRLLE